MNLRRGGLIVLPCLLALASEVSSLEICEFGSFPDNNIPVLLNSAAYSPGQEPLSFYVDQSTRSLNVDVDCGNHKNGACSTPMDSCLKLGKGSINDSCGPFIADSPEGCVMMPTFAPTSPPTATSSSMRGAKLTNWVSGVCGVAGLVIITSMF